MTAKNVDRRCKAHAKSGQPCRAAATEGGLCYFHANPDKASQLGRIGGRNNRHATGENVEPLPTLDNLTAVRDLVARLITDVYAGKINPRVAAGLAPLLNLQMRAIETEDLERRIAKLENPAAAGADRLAAANADLGTRSGTEVVEEDPLKVFQNQDRSPVAASSKKPYRNNLAASSGSSASRGMDDGDAETK